MVEPDILIENVFLLVFRNARAGVGDLDDGRGTAVLELEADLSGRRRIAKGVGEKIADDATEKDRIGLGGDLLHVRV